MREPTPPDRLWTDCHFGDENEVLVRGKGVAHLFDRFTIAANGVDVEVIVTMVQDGYRWTAEDVASFERRTRVERVS